MGSRPKVPRRRLMVERLEGGKTARVLAKKKGRKEGREEGDGDMSVSFLFWDGRRVGKWITSTMLGPFQFVQFLSCCCCCFGVLLGLLFCSFSNLCCCFSFLLRHADDFLRFSSFCGYFLRLSIFLWRLLRRKLMNLLTKHRCRIRSNQT